MLYRLPVLISAPQPICCNLWAHWVGYIYSLQTFQHGPYYISILSLTVSYNRTQTKTNNCTTISISTLAIHFVCHNFPLFSPILSILQHSCSELPASIEQAPQIRSDRIAVDSLRYKNSADGNDKHDDGEISSFLCSFVFDTSFVTTNFQQTRTIDFLLTDFNDFNGVGTSTSCFCLSYQNFLNLPRFPFKFKAPTTTNLIYTVSFL